ncbi:MAG: DUF1801 domain-containing protein [Microbacterium sp.]|jgi:hypothetical protein|uniref:DUF1801 domain-containing protein n=1 Tax=Microbacterium sp. TaxID=51671 RepID=UPI000DB7FA95|nr:DUF1801 domain-containing protein [Microbacterium sp.]PZU41092.1 MAG: DUF1801 domain-containing protein [Microbacterium sp.]
MKITGGDVDAFVAKVTPAARRRDAEALLALMREVSGREPELWGTIIGFGSCHYRYPTGTEGDSPIIAFAPRKQASTLYLLDGIQAHGERLAELGPHSTGVGCLYLSDVAAVDPTVLREIVAASHAFVTGGGGDYAQLTVTA